MNRRTRLMTTLNKPLQSRENWLHVIRHAPLVSLDLILRDSQDRVLLGWRNNAPARNCWFVPGGAIRKGETLDQALERISMAELGMYLSRREGQLLGLYEHFYPDNFAGAEGVGTHYVVAAHEFRVTQTLQPADRQHSRFQWWSTPELLAHPDVHPHVKAYFN